MITRAEVIDINDEILTLKVNEILLEGFSNTGITSEIGAIILVEIILWGDIEMDPAPVHPPSIEKAGKGLAYFIFGKLDVDNQTLSSVLDFELDNDTLARFSHLDQKNVRLSIERFDLCILEKKKQ